MAITKLTDANYSALFKTVWGDYGDNLYGSGVEDPVVSQLNKTFKCKGIQEQFPVKVTFGGGVGSGTLPTANASKYAQVTITTKNCYARINLDRKTIVSSRGNEAAFKEASAEETESKLKSFNRMMAMWFWNDGTGILGQFTGPATGTAAAPAMTALNTGTYKFRQAFFEEGDYVNIRTSGGVVLASTFEIASVNTTTRALTLTRITGADDLTALAVATHSIVMQNSYAAAPQGIKGAVEFASGSLYGVTFQRRWKSFGYDATSQSISIDHMNKGMIQIWNLSGEYPDMIALNPLQMERFLNRLGDRRVYCDMLSKSNSLASKVSVSFSVVMFDSAAGPVKVVSSRYVEEDRIYFVNTNKIEQKHAAEFGWFDNDGTVLLRMEGQDAYEARYGGYEENYINPLFQGYVYNLATS